MGLILIVLKVGVLRLSVDFQRWQSRPILSVFGDCCALFCSIFILLQPVLPRYFTDILHTITLSRT